MSQRTTKKLTVCSIHGQDGATLSLRAAAAEHILRTFSAASALCAQDEDREAIDEGYEEHIVLSKRRKWLIAVSLLGIAVTWGIMTWVRVLSEEPLRRQERVLTPGCDCLPYHFSSRRDMRALSEKADLLPPVLHSRRLQFILVYGLQIYTLLGSDAEQSFATQWAVSWALDNAQQWKDVFKTAAQVVLLAYLFDRLRIISDRSWFERCAHAYEQPTWRTSCTHSGDLSSTGCGGCVVAGGQTVHASPPGGITCISPPPLLLGMWSQARRCSLHSGDHGERSSCAMDIQSERVPSVHVEAQSLSCFLASEEGAASRRRRGRPAAHIC